MIPYEFPVKPFGETSSYPAGELLSIVYNSANLLNLVRNPHCERVVWFAQYSVPDTYATCTELKYFCRVYDRITNIFKRCQ